MPKNGKITMNAESNNYKKRTLKCPLFILRKRLYIQKYPHFFNEMGILTNILY